MSTTATPTTLSLANVEVEVPAAGAAIAAHFADQAEYAFSIQADAGGYGCGRHHLRFPAATADGDGDHEVVRVTLDYGDEAVVIAGETAKGWITFEARLGMSTPAHVIIATFEAAAGLDA